MDPESAEGDERLALSLSRLGDAGLQQQQQQLASRKARRMLVDEPAPRPARAAPAWHNRRGIKEETHPRRQSTPRRRLLEAKLADKAFCNGSTEEKLEETDTVPLTPRLMRSNSCFVGFARISEDQESAVGDVSGASSAAVVSGAAAAAAAATDAEYHSDDASSLASDASHATIVAKAYEVAQRTLADGARNAARKALYGSQSASVLPTHNT